MQKKSLLSLSILMALSPSAFAEQASSRFSEVVVSATRSEQNKQDVSASIDTVSANTIDKTMATDLQQALKYTPAVQVEQDGRFGISGFNIRGVDGSRVKTMVDGVQQPTPYNPGSNEQRHYPNAIEVDTLQSIEINKGPSSTLYGSDAMGGTVFLRTKNPSDLLLTDGDENRFGIKSSYTSADETFKNTLSWAMRQGDIETLVMATYADGGETKTHSSGSEVEGPDRGAANPADKTLKNLLLKSFYQPTDKQRMGLTVEYYDQDYEEDELNYNGYSIMPGFTYTDNKNKDNIERLRVGFEYQTQLDAILADSLEWKVNYQQSTTNNQNFDTTPFTGERMREREASDKGAQADVQLTKWFDVGDNSHQLTYGFSLLRDQFELDNTDYKYTFGTVGSGSTGIPDADITQIGVFVQDEAYLLDEDLILTAGLRYDSFKTEPGTDEGFTTQYEENQEDAFTAKLGAVYHLTDSTSVFGQISQGFKAPTVYDLYYVYNQGAIFNPNPDLKAEKSLAYELGLRSANDFADVEVTAFYNDYSDFITDANLGQQNGKDVYTKQNLDKVTIYGAEITTNLYLDEAIGAPQGMYLTASLAYADGEDEKTGKALDSVAPLTGVIGIGIDGDNYGALANVKMVARKDEWQSDTNVDAPGYATVDVTAYYQPMADLTLRAGVFNALDKKYWQYDDLAGTDAHTSNFNQDFKTQAGRNWGVSVEYEF